MNGVVSLQKPLLQEFYGFYHSVKNNCIRTVVRGVILVDGHLLLTWQLLSMHQQMLKTPYLLDKSAFRLHSLLSPG